MNNYTTNNILVAVVILTDLQKLISFIVSPVI